MLVTVLYGMVVGLSLGLTGGGGSIFAVPLLVYGLHLSFRESVSVSLLVVGLTALFGALTQTGKRQIRWLAGLMLGVGGALGAPMGAWAGGQIPDSIGLASFATLMLVLAKKMADGKLQDVPIPWISCARPVSGEPQFHLSCGAKLIGAGIVAGILSGIFGVGGGFLLVPALLIIAGLDLRIALGTSLVGIFLIAGSAFAANWEALRVELLPVTGWFLAGSFLGMLVGLPLRRHLPENLLRRIFALIIAGVGLFILANTFLPIRAD